MGRKRHWLWLLLLTLMAWGGLEIWDATTPISLITLSWHAPKPLMGGLATYDLDGDGNEEIVTEDGWLLQFHDNRIRAEKLPLQKGERTGWWGKIFKRAVLVDGLQGLWLLRWRKGWHRQKLAGRGTRFIVTDMDGDGQTNDIVVLVGREVRWFKVGLDGHARLQDALRLPTPVPQSAWLLSTGLKEPAAVSVWINRKAFIIWAWQGQLKKAEGEWHCGWLDVDNDGKTDLVRVSDKRITVTLSTKGQKEVTTTLPFSPNALYLFFFGDLNGDGVKELVGLDGIRHPVRCWIEGGQWRWEKGMSEVGHYILGTLRVRQRDWLVVWEWRKPTITAVWRAKTGWQRKQWRLTVSQDTDVWRCQLKQERGNSLLFVDCGRLPEHHPFWRHWLAITRWLRRIRIPVPVPQSRWFVQVWRWDKEVETWQRWEPPFWARWEKPIDLNGDGEVEWVGYEALPFSVWLKSSVIPQDNLKLALKVGRLRKRWRVVRLEKIKVPCPIAFLRQGRRTWIVLLDAKTRRLVRAWALK